MQNKSLFTLKILFFLFFTTVSKVQESGANTSKITDNSLTTSDLKLKVVYGDKVSQFTLNHTAPRKISFSNSAGAQKSIVLSDDDYKYLVAKLKNVNMPSSNSQKCRREYTQFVYGNSSFKECLSERPAMRSLQRVANLLAVYVR